MMAVAKAYVKYKSDRKRAPLPLSPRLKDVIIFIFNIIFSQYYEMILASIRVYVHLIFTQPSNKTRRLDTSLHIADSVIEYLISLRQCNQVWIERFPILPLLFRWARSIRMDRICKEKASW